MLSLKTSDSSIDAIIAQKWTMRLLPSQRIKLDGSNNNDGIDQSIKCSY
jgi:hypothetical protein